MAERRVKTGAMKQQPRKARMVSIPPAAGLPDPRTSPPCPHSDHALLQSCERVSVTEAAQRVAFCYGSRSKRMQTNSYKGANNKNENMSLAKSDGPAPLWKGGFLCLQYCSNLESEGLGPGGPPAGTDTGVQGHLLGSA